MYKVLVVDDFEADRIRLRKIIASWNENAIQIIGECESGIQALNFIEENRPDLVISDIEMPYMNGIEMAKNIKSRYHNEIKIVFCTLYNEFKYAKEAIFANSYGYILKPLQSEELLECIKRVMGDIRQETRFRDEYNHMRDALEKAKPILADNFLKDILYGTSPNEADIWEKAEYFQIRFTRGYYRLLYIEIDDYDSIMSSRNAEGKQLFSMKVFDSIQSTVDNFKGYPVTRMGEMHFAVMVSERDEDLAKVNAYDCARRIENLVKETEVSLTVALSDSAGALEEMKNLLEQCKFLLRYKFSIGKGQIISCEDIPVNTGFDSIDINLLQKDVKYLLNSAGQEDIIQYIDNQIQKLAGNACENMLRNYCFLMVICVKLALNENNLDLGEVSTDENLIWEKLRRFETILDAGNWLKNLLFFANEALSRKVSGKNNGIVEEIKRYVTAHLHRNIGLDDLASELHYSPNYLNYVFKQASGGTITDFIAERKMEKAREMLADVRNKVQDISESLGYSHAAYFCSVFKKSSGMTPKEYRERVMG